VSSVIAVTGVAPATGGVTPAMAAVVTVTPTVTFALSLGTVAVVRPPLPVIAVTSLASWVTSAQYQVSATVVIGGV